MNEQATIDKKETVSDLASVEFSLEETEHTGVFVKDAMREEDALESTIDLERPVDEEVSYVTVAYTDKSGSHVIEKCRANEYKPQYAENRIYKRRVNRRMSPESEKRLDEASAAMRKEIARREGTNEQRQR